MSVTEKSLTALALALLTFWELAHGAIPLGLVAIEQRELPWLFGLVSGLQLTVALLWLSQIDISARCRSLMRRHGGKLLGHTP